MTTKDKIKLAEEIESQMINLYKSDQLDKKKLDELTEKYNNIGFSCTEFIDYMNYKNNKLVENFTKKLSEAIIERKEVR